MKFQFKLTILIILSITQGLNGLAKIMRNNALMNQMMSHFQKDNALSMEPELSKQPVSREEITPHTHHSPRDREAQTGREQQDRKTPIDRLVPVASPLNSRILSLMQNVLCKNFPSIPCNVILKDNTLRQLMERSVQQISHKKKNMNKKTTALSPPGATGLPIINSEDLSSFLRVADTGYFSGNKVSSLRKKKTGNSSKMKNFWSHEKSAKNKIMTSKDNKRTEVYAGRKKLRKFYPHKVKHKDKKGIDHKGGYSDEKSMSLEIPDVANPAMQLIRKPHNLAFKAEDPEAPIWRIDYTKHGEPSLNLFNFDQNRLQGKLMQAAPSGIVGDKILDQASNRKDVLHPDLYIKKNFVRRKTPLMNVNSDGAE